MGGLVLTSRGDPFFFVLSQEAIWRSPAVDGPFWRDSPRLTRASHPRSPFLSLAAGSRHFLTARKRERLFQRTTWSRVCSDVAQYQARKTGEVPRHFAWPRRTPAARTPLTNPR